MKLAISMILAAILAGAAAYIVVPLFPAPFGLVVATAVAVVTGVSMARLFRTEYP